MSKILTVAWREFKHTALTKSFLLAAVFGPIVMFVAAIVLPVLLQTPPKKLEGALAVVDPTGLVLAAVEVELDPARIGADRDEQLAGLEAAIENMPEQFRAPVEDQIERLKDALVPAVTVESTDDVETAKQRVLDGELIGVALYRESVMVPTTESNAFELYLPADLSRRHGDLIEDRLSRAVVRARADRSQLDLEKTRALLRPPTAIRSTITAEGETRENELARIFVPFGFMMLLWMSSWIGGQYLLTSTIEEKSNRVMEVLLSAVSPMQLMAGKILGQAAVGLAMLALYAILGAASADRFGVGHLVPLHKLLYLAIYFFIAYFTIAALMAAVGSAVNELRDAQTFMGPITLIFMVPFFLWFVVSDEPNSSTAVALSFIPPLSPFVMVLRIAGTETIPFWQIAATTALGLVTVWASVWACAKIFRVGVLLYGKPPTPRELVRWIREA